MPDGLGVERAAQEQEGEPCQRFYLWREFEFKNFKESMAFVSKVADLGESEGHHPDIRILYNLVHLELSTHSIGGLSENDFILAAKLNLIR